ncbi:ubiquitin carboxyl-terminal hydrolase MINDY-1 isoform X3 [Echeneis naucrates]|uniref:ubiquitin carboxyl-terminal hydrolase MINDY-1 isoform X3 n=1 Tax=Echeneis naucrates TaxID=173247 RepID=UPI00111371B1|nr:ubiquitin carboxyl-terminal hydrolase MINDY-1 isoform X3 [Echeneis naucrates]
MAESSSQPVMADQLVDPTLTESVSKELIVTIATEEPARMQTLDLRDNVLSSNGDADSPLPGKDLKEEVTPTPAESSMASSENGIVTMVTTVTTEEEDVSTLLRHTETFGGQNRAGDPGLDLDLEDSLSMVTGGGSEDQQESTDSASLSIPSLELSDGFMVTGSSLDVEDGLSSTCSAPGCSQSTRVPGLKDQDSPGPAGDDTMVLLSTGGTAAADAPLPPASSSSSGPAAESRPAVPVYYLVKWISWKEKKTPIITQSENGPCPLLAIMNTLFLRWKAKLPAQTEVVTTEELMAHLGECVLSVTPREKTDGMELNFQQNMSDAMAVLPKLSTGLDVNVRFTGVSDFEYTPECIVFDLLDIPLYHGWLLDPQSPEMAAAVGKLSYNQLVEKIIDYKHSADSSRVSEGLLAEQFLESTATQLSYHGLCELNTTVKEGEISVFFRNNHFSTMIKHKGYLYLLVTDQGFLQEDSLIWESLHNVEGDGNFCDSDFRLCHQRAPPTATLPPSTQDQQRQIDQDYLVAVSLQQQDGAPGPLSDLELARQLQQEEYQQRQQQGPGQAGQQAGQQVRGQGSQQARRRDKDSDCVLL